MQEIKKLCTGSDAARAAFEAQAAQLPEHGLAALLGAFRYLLSLGLEVRPDVPSLLQNKENAKRHAAVAPLTFGTLLLSNVWRLASVHLSRDMISWIAPWVLCEMGNNYRLPSLTERARVGSSAGDPQSKYIYNEAI